MGNIPFLCQNQINKNYIIEKLNGEFFLSTNENTYGANNIVLRSLLKKKILVFVCYPFSFA